MSHAGEIQGEVGGVGGGGWGKEVLLAVSGDGEGRFCLFSKS